MQRRQSEPVGLLRVSAPVFYGRRYLAPVVLEFLARYPEVRVELVLGNRRSDLLEEGFDVAVHIGRLDDSSLVARKVSEGAVHFVASPAFLSRHGPPPPIARVPAAPCRDAVRDGRLKVLFAQEPSQLLPSYAVYPSRRHLEQKVRAFVDFLQGVYGPTPYWDRGLSRDPMEIDGTGI